MSNNENALSCDPANPRRSQVSGPASVKLATEDSTGVGDQAPVIVNATGSKTLVQQAFHPALFITRPRSASLGSTSKKTSSDEQNTKNSLSSSENPLVPPPWQKIPVSRNKKRKLSEASPTEKTTTSNRFKDLPVDITDDDTTSVATKLSKPPPIVLYGIEDLNKLTELLETAAQRDQFTYKTVNKTQLRISTIDIDVYKKLISLIRENKLIGHTFNRKDKRCYRIVVRNLHPSTPLNVIKEDIKATGNTVCGEIINVKFGPDKVPTTTFFVNLIAGPSNKNIKNLRYIYHQSVVIEEPRKRKTLVQCQRCQQYGHTKNYCMRPYRCVKCGQPHKTSECEKRDRSTPASCALCNGPHPANYKGCEVYKEILARKQKNTVTNIKSQDKFTPKNSLYYEKRKTEHVTHSQPVTYADVLRTTPYIGTRNATPIPAPGQMNQTLEQILMKQTEKFEIILQQMSILMGLIAKLIDNMTK